jgi:hypothetical protein
LKEKQHPHIPPLLTLKYIDGNEVKFTKGVMNPLPVMVDDESNKEIEGALSKS